jgi:sarcosine oxidase subunit gamma
VIEPYLRQSALDHLALARRVAGDLGTAAVRLSEKTLPAAVNLRGDPEDADFLSAVRGVLDLDLPLAPNRVSASASLAVLWLGPDEWLVVQHDATPEAEVRLAARLRDALGGRHASVVEVGEQYCCITVAGARARELIMKGCPLDLHPRAFGGVGHCAQSHLSKSAIILHQVSDEPAFELYVRRSFADYLWRWLEDAAREYGHAAGKP